MQRGRQLSGTGGNVHNIIMAPTDGSGFDREAVRIAARLSNFPGSELKLVRIYSAPMVFTGPDMIDYPHEAIERERESMLSDLRRLAADCSAETCAQVSFTLQEGPVEDALVHFAAVNDVDLIVMSSHSRGGFARITLGSVTDSLIRNANTPVLVVKRGPSALTDSETRPFRKILIPLDGSKLAEEIIPQAAELARMNGAAVVLVHVLVPRTYSQKQIVDSTLPWWENDIDVAQTYLHEQAESLREAGIPATIDIAIAEGVADGIMRAAARIRADVIAIATRGRGGLSRMVRGSTADRVVRMSRVSLLVFHPKAPAKAAVTLGREAAEMGYVPAA